jgi:hypothetical protein
MRLTEDFWGIFWIGFHGEDYASLEEVSGKREKKNSFGERKYRWKKKEKKRRRTENSSVLFLKKKKKKRSS